MTDSAQYDTHRLLIRADPRLCLGEPFTYAEARRYGVSPTELRTMVRSGLIRRVFAGVYIDSAAADTQLTRTQSLAKILPVTAVVTDESAGWVHMIDLDPPGALVIAPPVTVFQTGGATRVRKAGTRGGQRGLLDRDIQVIHGIRVTSPLRTALDLGRLRQRDRAFLDLANEKLRFAVEFDGRTWPEDEADVRRDQRRRAWLAQEGGWGFAILTGRDLQGVPRDHTANVVRRHLEAHLRRTGDPSISYRHAANLAT